MKHLFNLIKSLTKSEKRYFNLSTQNERSLKYVELFKVFESKNKYDKDKIVQELAKLDFEFKYLADDVNYLYYKLLENLSNFNKTKSIQNRIKENIGFVVVLIDKGLIKDAQKIIKSTKKLIIESERFNFLVEVIDLELKVFGNLYNVKKIDREKQKNEQLIELIRQKKKVENDYWQCVLMSKKWPESKKAYKECINYYDNHKIDKLETNSSKITALQIHQLFYFLESNRESELLFLEKQLLLINNQFKLYKKEYFSSYIKIYSRKLYLDFALNPHKITKTVEIFYNLPVRHKSNSLMDIYFVKIFTFNFVLEYYIRGNHFLLAVAFIEQQNFDLESYQKYSNESFLISALYKIAYSYYRNSNHNLAIDFCNKIDSFYKEETRIEVYHFNKLLMLFIHYDLKNYRLVENLIKYNVRFFVNSFTLYNVNKFCKEMFLDLISYGENINHDRMGIYEKKYFEDKSLQVIEKYFDIKWWFKKDIINSKSFENQKSESITFNLK